jgi:type IX secretion system PorP/SprF family membrane protein
MDFEFSSRIEKRAVVLLISTSFIISSFGQQTPQFPISHRIFTPFVFNPAIAGSKDFFSVDFSAGKSGKANSQLLSGNMRVTKPPANYALTQPIPEFTNFGVGGYLYNDFNGTTRNLGFCVAGSYHLQLDKSALSFLSVGVSARIVSNKYSGNTDLGEPSFSKIFPDFDAGIYYYRTNFYAGISGTNLFGTPSNPDTLTTYTVPVSRQLFLTTGYKVILSKSRNILLEPFLILNSDDTFSGDIIDMIQPGLKLYAGNFCVGTYFNDFDRTSFFFQYKYRSFYVGAYFSLPNNTPFYKDPIIEEISIGFNLSSIKSGISRMYHW